MKKISQLRAMMDVSKRGADSEASASAFGESAARRRGMAKPSARDAIGGMPSTRRAAVAVAAMAAAACGLALLALARVRGPAGAGGPVAELTLSLARASPRAPAHVRARARLAATPIRGVHGQASHIRCAIQSLSGGVSPDASGCPVEKVVPPPPSGFPDPRFSQTGAQYNENGAGWTTSGVLDNSEYAAGDIERWPISDKPGHVREINGDPEEAGSQYWGTLGGLGTHCGCAICPCRGDDDIDSVSNGEWAWPVQAVRTPPPQAVRGSSSQGGSTHSHKKSCPDCEYVAHVKPVSERFLATVVPVASHSSSSSHDVKTITKYKTKFVALCCRQMHR